MSFAKILSGTQLQCQTFWMQTRNDFQLVLILVLILFARLSADDIDLNIFFSINSFRVSVGSDHDQDRHSSWP